MNRKFSAISLIFFASFLQAKAQSYDPISTTNNRPYSLLFLRFDPTGKLLPLGSRKFSIQFTAANSLTIIDNRTTTILKEIIESDILRFNYTFRGSNGIQYQISVPIEDMGPGFMDPIIDWYHRTILHLNSIRSQIPYGGHIVYSPAGGPNTGGFGLGDTILTASYSILPQTIASFALKLPTGNPNILTGSGRPDAGIALEHFVKVGKFFGLTLQSAFIAQSQAVHLKYTRPFGWQLCAALTWNPNSRDRWTAQWQRESSALNMGVPLSDQIHASFTLGYIRKITHATKLESFFTEDMDLLNPNLPIGAQVGPDFVVGLKLSWQLK